MTITLVKISAEIRVPLTAAPDQNPGTLRESADLAIDLDEANPERLIFSFTGEKPEHTKSLSVTLKEPHSLTGDPRDIDSTVELEIEKSGADSLIKAGLLGLDFSASAELTAIRIRLRPSRPDRSWSIDAPFFTLLACWRLKGTAEGATVYTGVDGAKLIGNAEATMSAELCAGFAVIDPPSTGLGVDSLRFRVDLDAFGLTSGWQPFSLIDFGGISVRHLNRLARWFATAVGLQAPSLFDGIDLPDWDIDLPLLTDLPFGLQVRKAEFSLRKRAAGYHLRLHASDFVLTLMSEKIMPGDLALDVELIDDGATQVYRMNLTVWESLYPANEQDVGPAKFSLPFDALSLEADCWRLRVGLHSGGTAGSFGDVCMQAVLEVGGLKISSAIGGSKPLYETSLRLFTRNFRVMQASSGDIPPLFSGLQSTQGAFEDYAGKPADGLTFARNYKATPSGPQNDYGIEFLDGDMRKGERFFLAWKQKGDQVLRALAHDLFARPPAGKVPDGAREFYCAVEVGWFGPAENPDLQIRLDWSEEIASSLPAGVVQDVNAWTPVPDPDDNTKVIGHRLDLTAGALNRPIALPPGAKGVALTTFEDATTFDLPGVSLAVARPSSQSLVFQRNEGRDAISYLFFYDGTGASAGSTVPAVARAQLGFSLKDPDGGKETMDSGSAVPFLDLGLGFGGNGKGTIRVFGWRKDEPPRFFDAYASDAPPIDALIRANAAAPAPPDACPVAPPEARQAALALRYDDFETPDFNALAGSADTSASDWQLTFRLAAKTKLMELFGNETDPNKVEFEILSITKMLADSHLLIATDLSVDLDFGDTGKFSAKGKLTFKFDPSDFSLSIADGAALSFGLKTATAAPLWTSRVPLPPVPPNKKRVWGLWPDGAETKPSSQILGLDCFVYADLDEDQFDADSPVDFLTLSLDNGRLLLSLPEGRDMLLRYDDLGRDSLAFFVDDFGLGPGGVSLSASLLSTTLSVKGLKKPFALEKTRLEIVENRLDTFSISASGNLPELLDEAPISLTVTLRQDKPGQSIKLDELICELGNDDEPIFSRGTRFKFEIKELELRYLGSPGSDERHFFFEVTGSAQFSPDPGEFDGGLLEDLKSIRVEFLRAPLTDEFTDHLSLSIELTEPKTFEVFKLFRMEVRSIGFHPNFDEFAEAGPALIIGGQCEFADAGDVVSAEIDFHAMYIGLPKSGEAVPQVHFDGLRVDISSDEGFRIAGRLDRYDTNLVQGFAGEGTIQIPGFPELSAAFAFVRLRANETDPWKHGWFIALEAAKISYQLAPLPIYLRQIGLGFGYRYTLPLIKEFEEQGSLRDMVNRMLKALNNHQTLARIDSWTRDPDIEDRPALWTIALEAVFTLGTSQGSPFDYDARAERELKTIVAQLIAAIRSDFTLVAAAKVWFPVSADDFFKDKDGMRNRPLVSGFMIYSAPQKRFLAHAAKSPKPYLGDVNDPWPEEIHSIFDNSHFEATMLIEPSLLHAELGWPDRLMFRFQIGSLVIECRAGVLLRIENDTIIQGVFLSARGSMDLAGGVNLGFVGVRVSAHVSVYFATRLMTALYLSRPLSSKIYAEVGLDIAVRFSVQAWLRLKIGFCKISIDISFSFSVQIVVGLELGWNGVGSIGFRGRATVAIGVFGRSLRASVAVGLNEGAVNGARNALLPYMSSFLEPGEPPRVPDGNLLSRTSNRTIGARSLRSPVNRASSPSNTAGNLPDPSTSGSFTPAAAENSPAGQDGSTDREISKEEFVTSHVISRGEHTYVWIMPSPRSSYFYPVPTNLPDQKPEEEADRWREYAVLQVPAADSTTKIETYRVSKNEDENGWQVRNTLYANFWAGLALSTESQGETELKLLDLLVGCYALKKEDAVKWAQAEGEDPTFPEDWKDFLEDVKADLKTPQFRNDGDRLEDERVFDPADPARGPKRELDARSAYDRALQRAINEPDTAEFSPEKQVNLQALGNQSYLLQSFYDDLVKIAEGRLSEIKDIKERPTILDLGMVFRVTGKPSWLSKRDADPLKMTFPDAGNLAPSVSGAQLDTRPVIDFTRVDYSTYPPVFASPISYFDEDVLGLNWRLEWGGGEPQSAAGADTDPESFLRAYDIQVVDLGTQRLIKRQTVKPCDLLAPEEKGEGEQFLRTRFKITLPVEDLFPKEALQSQRLLRVGVTVTPIDQVGRAGASFTFTPKFEPVLTPLPADDAKLVLEKDAAQEGTVRARLSWRELSLPDRPGIARTDRWQIILRPLREVPMGSYPEETAEAEERGLMSATGQSLLDGDIIVELPDMENMPSNWLRAGDREGLDPAERGYEIVIGANGVSVSNRRQVTDKEPWPDNWRIVDQTRTELTEGPLVEAARSFFSRIPASDNSELGDGLDGRSWRVFLRAVSVYKGNEDDSTDDRVTYSGLVQVKLATLLPPEQSSATSARTDSVERPLPHFEWPTERPDTVSLTKFPHADAGVVKVPVAVSGNGGKNEIKYIDEPGMRRAVTLEWPAVPDADGGSYEAVADYRVLMAGLDSMVNADDVPSLSEFSLDWRQVARVFPADKRAAADAPDSLSNPQNWVSRTPAFAATQAWFARNRVDRRNQLRNQPGWYSWSETGLDWPEPLLKVEAALNELSRSSTRSPAEVLGLPDDTAVAARLAAWYDLGTQVTGTRVHPLLALITGYIAGLRGYQDLILTDPKSAPARFQVEASPGEVVEQRDAFTWLSANTAAVDPVGWTALGHLGLGLALALRDPVTGLKLPQQTIDEQIANAIAEIPELFDTVWEKIDKANTNLVKLIGSIDDALLLKGTFKPDLRESLQTLPHLLDLPDKASSELTAAAAVREDEPETDTTLTRETYDALLRAKAELDGLTNAKAELEKLKETRSLSLDDLISRHLSFDHPIQTVWAERTTSENARLADASLNLLHLSLRPVPKMAGLYVELLAKATTPISPPENTRLSIHWQNRAVAPVHLISGAEEAPVASLKQGDRVFVRALHDSGSPTHATLTAWLDGLKQTSSIDFSTTVTPAPLPLLSPNTGPRQSPFAAFSVDTDYWARFTVGDQKAPNPSGSFATLAGYLERAFGIENADPNDPLSLTPSDVRQKLFSSNGVTEVLLRWADRFFKTAPLEQTANLLFEVDPQTGDGAVVGNNETQQAHVIRNRTISAPKSIDPIRIAADSAGLMRLTLPVVEEWASARSFVITSTDRYKRLRIAMGLLDATPARERGPVFSDLPGPEERADAHLPRVRQVEAPQILGQRRLSATSDGETRWLNEIFIARHAEESLSLSNVQAARKLDFGVLARSYEREFLFQDWKDKLMQPKWLEGQKLELPTDTGLHKEKPKTEETGSSELTLLSAVPTARFGAEAVLTYAAPFYYRTEIELVATAGTEVSEPATMPMSPASPGDPDPDKPIEFEGFPKTPAYQAVRDENLDWGVVPDWSRIEERSEAWPLPDLDVYRKWLSPKGVQLRIRLPRLAESLPASSLSGDHAYHRAEIGQTTSVGLLPDPGVRLHILESITGSRSVIATISSNLEADGGPFSAKLLDKSFAPFEDLEADQVETWFNGMVIAPVLRSEPAILERNGLPLPPENLSANFEDPLPVGSLTRSQSLDRLLPLALRLFGNGSNKLEVLEPFAGPRWLVRLTALPGSSSAEEPMSPEDLATGLRVLLDWHRRNAVSLVSHDIDQDIPGDLQEILLAAETADLVHLSPRTVGFEMVLSEINDLGDRLKIWLREEKDGSLVWVRVTPELLDGVPNGVERHVLIASPQQEATYFAQLSNRAGIHAEPGAPDPLQIKATTDTAKELGDLAFRPRAIPEPEIHVQRGNNPRLLWAKPGA